MLTHERLSENATRLAGYFLERGPILQALNAALVAREHVLMVGPPGVAKSALSRAWASQVQGVYREELFTRQTTESDVLAYLDVQAFREGRHVYRYDSKISEAHVAFADEIFKASGGFLNALLGWLNERNVRGGFKSPLQTCVAASNEFAGDDALAALDDRILVRFWVEPIQDSQLKIQYLRNIATRAPVPALEPITLAELQAAQAEAAALPIEGTVLASLMLLQQTLAGVGVTVSDRRLGACTRLLQAAAWCSGKKRVDVTDLAILKHVLWMRPEQQEEVGKAVDGITRGIVGECQRLADAALERVRIAESSGQFAEQALLLADEIRKATAEIKALMEGADEELRAKVRPKVTALGQAFERARKASKLEVPPVPGAVRA